MGVIHPVVVYVSVKIPTVLLFIASLIAFFIQILLLVCNVLKTTVTHLYFNALKLMEKNSSLMYNLNRIYSPIGKEYDTISPSDYIFSPQNTLFHPLVAEILPSGYNFMQFVLFEKVELYAISTFALFTNSCIPIYTLYFMYYYSNPLEIGLLRLLNAPQVNGIFN